MNTAIVITTICQEPTEAISRFSQFKNSRLIVVGDKKSPASYDIDADYLDIERQTALYNDLSLALPFNHYTRKNVGYAFAINKGYSVIAESDDDNIPNENWLEVDCEEENDNTVVAPHFPNIYSLFTREKIWPRGYPIDLINVQQEIVLERKKLRVGVWQGLVDKEADVDAIYRLIINKEIEFDRNKRFVLDRGVVSPFNSQNTIWRKNSFAYLYLPCTVSFRYTDILRSFVAQFGLWARGLHIGFISPNCHQVRNPHLLINDFKDEISMYLECDNVINTLKSCSNALTGADNDLLVMYQALYKAGVVKNEEIDVAERWLAAIQHKMQ